jgi:serine protease Do
MTKNKVLYIVLVIVLSGVSTLTGSLAGGFAVYQVMHSYDTAAVVQDVSPLVDTIATNTDSSTTLLVGSTDVQTAISQSVQAVGPAVVTVVGKIKTTSSGDSSSPGSDEVTVSGSGFFISDDGYILTNNHVVEGTSSVTIILSDGTSREAEIVGTDIYSDIAVLKSEGAVPAVAVLGNSDLLDPGETVIAIGSPLGDFTNTVTVGVVSATDRSLDTGAGYQIEGLIQTDAAINQGNSGGPLVNLAGEVIGINTMIVRDTGTGVVAEGLGFSIPSNTAFAVAEQIIENGYFSRPYLGVSFSSITPQIATMYSLPVEYGAYIATVQSGSPASLAGLRAEDIVTAVGGISIDVTHSFLNILFQYKPGDQITLQFVRSSEQKEVQVTLGESGLK